MGSAGRRLEDCAHTSGATSPGNPAWVDCAAAAVAAGAEAHGSRPLTSSAAPRVAIVQGVAFLHRTTATRCACGDPAARHDDCFSPPAKAGHYIELAGS